MMSDQVAEKNEDWVEERVIKKKKKKRQSANKKYSLL